MTKALDKIIKSNLVTLILLNGSSVLIRSNIVANVSWPLQDYLERHESRKNLIWSATKTGRVTKSAQLQIRRVLFAPIHTPCSSAGNIVVILNSVLRDGVMWDKNLA
ncbi:hypothetical protein BZG73_15740 [Salinivibrio siamensis]|uniref:Uncharacterized protein n=1 Tax=Salinivibrio siamensis TaxID=414286 RepID=A0ABX3K4S9_9GAMM|nr:hypothetical protein BZG73_15740 [Salinivibrio siamensis]